MIAMPGVLFGALPPDLVKLCFSGLGLADIKSARCVNREFRYACSYLLKERIVLRCQTASMFVERPGRGDEQVLQYPKTLVVCDSHQLTVVDPRVIRHARRIIVRDYMDDVVYAPISSVPGLGTPVRSAIFLAALRSHVSLSLNMGVSTDVSVLRHSPALRALKIECNNFAITGWDDEALLGKLEYLGIMSTSPGASGFKTLVGSLPDTIRRVEFGVHAFFTGSASFPHVETGIHRATTASCGLTWDAKYFPNMSKYVVHCFETSPSRRIDATDILAFSAIDSVVVNFPCLPNRPYPFAMTITDPQDLLGTTNADFLEDEVCRRLAKVRFWGLPHRTTIRVQHRDGSSATFDPRDKLKCSSLALPLEDVHD